MVVDGVFIEGTLKTRIQRMFVIAPNTAKLEISTPRMAKLVDSSHSTKNIMKLVYLRSFLKYENSNQD